MRLIDTDCSATFFGTFSLLKHLVRAISASFLVSHTVKVYVFITQQYLSHVHVLCNENLTSKPCSHFHFNSRMPLFDPTGVTSHSIAILTDHLAVQRRDVKGKLIALYLKEKVATERITLAVQ